MKKNIFSIASVAALICGSMMMSSCAVGTVGSALASTAAQTLLSNGENLKSQDVQNSTLGIIANSLLTSFMAKGTDFNYSGTATVEALSGTYEPMAYNTIGKGTPILAVKLTTNQTTIAQSTTAAISLPAFTVANGITVSDIAIANLGVTTKDNISTLALTDASGFSGTATCTVNSQSFTAATCYITSCTVSNSELKLEITLYYGKDYTNPVNLSYTGKIQ